MTTPLPEHPYLTFLRSALPAVEERRPWTPADGPMPALYLGHGAPPLFEDRGWMDQLFAWAQALPTPKDILIVSAHWESAPVSITSTEAATPLVYDFWGFDQLYYEMTYKTPDASELGRTVASLMPDTEPLHEHRGRGLDHGAWVPLKVMYPKADIPAVQLSLPTHDPASLLRLGARLAELRAQGTLVIGSGFMTHGLPFLSREHFMNRGAAPGWSREFDAWAKEALDAGDVDLLSAFRTKAPAVQYAHPTVEHFTPLFVTLGAGGAPGTPVETTIDGFAMGLAKRSFQTV